MKDSPNRFRLRKSIVYFPATVSCSALLCLLGLRAAPPQEGDYSGAAACAGCHQDRFQAQSRSNHANTWRLSAQPPFQRPYQQRVSEGVQHRVDNSEGALRYGVQLNPASPELVLPVHSVVGGTRFGFSFLLELDEIAGLQLNRPALIEGRFMHSAQSGALTLSPGFPAEQPVSWATALGRVLSPSFEKKCLDCHGGIRQIPLTGPLEHPQFKDVGVRCERCHGPGRPHVEAMQRKEQEMKILHPGRLPKPQLLELCGQCHSGFTSLADPRPQDLLISNQVTALKLSACYLGSGRQLTCLNCHNPHENAKKDDPIYVRACLSCHRTSLAKAKHCPISPRDGCVDCHMPVVDKPGNFHLRDHWIRVVGRPLPLNVRDVIASGIAWAEKGETPRALQEFKRALGIQPREPSVYYNLGLAYEETGDRDQAQEAYRQAVTLEPDLVSAYINWGSLLLSLGKWEDAMHQFSRAADINPLEPAAHYNLAIAYQTKGEGQKAQQAARLAEAIDPRLKSR